MASTKPADGDWKVSTLTWTFTLAIVFLGSSAALFGRWVEREGPRKAGVVAAICWGGGFFISAIGIHLHQIWLLYLGSGVIGGCGLGLGYISPVSTLMKWFPDRRGMATGLAIMGFGGGAMIGTPLADLLMKRFATPDSVGVWQTFVVFGVDLFRRDDGRRVRLSLAGAGLGACGLDAAGRRTRRGGHGIRAGGRRVEDAAVLVSVGRALHERHGRHRRARDRVADDSGNLQGTRDGIGGRGIHEPAEPVQYRRQNFLGVAVRSHRPEADVHDLLRARHAACTRQRRARAEPAASRSSSASTA